MDLAGNAEEWVQDWLDFNYYRRPESAKDPQGPEKGHKRVVKGGSYGTDRFHIRIATRLYGAPEDRSELLGFRCARTP
jgi:formylglycine-generating enzyme required for sulfatase activity